MRAEAVVRSRLSRLRGIAKPSMMRSRRVIGATLMPDVIVDLQRLQKTLFGDARDAPIGEQIEILTLRLDQGQPHLRPAFDAGHLDGSPKAGAGRRWPGYLQHRILEFPGGIATPPTWATAQYRYVRSPTQLKRVVGWKVDPRLGQGGSSTAQPLNAWSRIGRTTARQMSRFRFPEPLIRVFRIDRGRPTCGATAGYAEASRSGLIAYGANVRDPDHVTL